MNDVSGEESTGEATDILGAPVVSAANDAGDDGEPASLEHFDVWFSERLNIRKELVGTITSMP